MKLLSMVLLLGISACGGSPKQTKAQDMEADIAKRGAKSVVSELNAGKGSVTWSYLEDKVASGDLSWLKVAQELKPFTDAGNAEGLTNAVADALPKSTAYILGMLGNSFPVNHVCSGGQFIEVPNQTVINFLKAARKAVVDVKDPGLEKQKVSCLNQMDISLKILAMRK